MSESSLIWQLLLGSVGMAYMIYGRRQKHTIAFMAGIGLSVFPYFISGTFGLVTVGGLLIAVPFLI